MVSFRTTPALPAVLTRPLLCFLFLEGRASGAEPGWLASRVPNGMHREVWGLAGWQWGGVLVAAMLAFLAGRAVTFAVSALTARLARQTQADWDDELVRAMRRPSRFLVGVLAFTELLRPLELGATASGAFARLLGIVMIGAVAWAIVGVIGVAASAVERRVPASAGGADAEARARGLKTQVRVLRRVANIGIGIVAAALMLMQFEVVRSVGVSLLASAGVAGVVLGFAAQRTIGSLIAGIQLSFTQPIRIGDVVVVEKEWGTIEEITLTFVVVRVWDERRLIVPMTRFLEQPFENWTKTSTELHGTVFLHVDWGTPIDAMRAELARILESDTRWDGRTKGISVTGTTERTLEVRALVSARNAGDLWDLRVRVREELIAWLQRCEQGRHLPRLRLAPDAGRDAASITRERATVS